MPYKIQIYKTPEEKSAAAEDINEYFRIRDEQYKKVWKDPVYANYPNEYDKKDDTVFIILKITDEKDEEIVVGGSRVIFPERNTSPTLNKMPIVVVPSKLSDRFRPGNKLSVADIVPGITEQPDIKYSELGGLAIDTKKTVKYLGAEDAKKLRDAAISNGMVVTREAGADLMITFSHKQIRKSVENCIQDNGYDYVSFKGHEDMIQNVFPEGHEAKALVVNVSEKYKLRGASGILRSNQAAAQEIRSSSR